MRLVLASASPRRLALLRLAGLKPRVLPSRLPESRLPGEGPRAMVRRLALAKAAEAAARAGGDGGLVLAADTTVAAGSRVLEKPRSRREAAAMLALLSGRCHSVHTGVCLLRPADGKRLAFVESTRVCFRRLSPAEIRAYVATGEPLDKAGAYGIQGGAAAFVLRIAGDYSNVVGLPLARTLQALRGLEAARPAARRAPGKRP